MSTDIWTRVRSMVHPGDKIPNWTYAGQGDTFDMTVLEVKRDSVIIDNPGAKSNQNVPRKDFEKVWEIWIEYKSGKVKRFELRDMSHYSTYVISIFKWME